MDYEKGKDLYGNKSNAVPRYRKGETIKIRDANYYVEDIRQDGELISYYLREEGSTDADWYSEDDIDNEIF